MRRSALISILTALAFSCCRAPAVRTSSPSVPPPATAAYPKITPERTILEELPTGGQESRFEVSIARCEERACKPGECAPGGRRVECPLQVRLLRGTTLLDTASLEWRCAPRPPVTRGPLRADGWRPSDSLANEAQGIGWLTGEESTSLDILVRSVRLDARRWGLLVDLRAGFEHVKRRHVLFVARGEQLIRAWSASDAMAGPSWSTVALLDRTDRQALLHIQGFQRSAETDEPDDLGHQLLVWDDGQQKIVSSARDPSLPLHAVAVGQFQSVASARKAQGRLAACSVWLQAIVSADHLRAPGPSGYVLLGISARRAVVEKVLRAATKCDPSLHGVISVLR